MKKALLVILCFVFAMTAFAGCGVKEAAPEPGSETTGDFDQYIYFGHNYELTGANPIIGESSIKGIDMAVNEINAAGGITVNGKTYGLAYKALDNGFNTDESALNAQEFADDEEICAMIGPNDSDMCMATQAIVTEEGLPAITPWSTLVELTSSEWYFRACFTDDFQGAILAKYAYEFENAKTAAVLYDMSNPYNEGIATRFKEVYEQLGGTVVEYLSYNGKTGETDFTSQMTKIASAQPDILLLPNFYEEIITQTTQARDMGYTGKFMGSDTWGDTSLLEWDTEHLLEGALWVGHYHKDVASEAALRFIENYHTKYGTEGDPNDIVALNYDSVYLLKLAIENAQSFDRSAIREGLMSIKTYEGVTGTMTFDNGNGDPTKSAVIIQIHDGEFTYLDTIEP
jgi:branched-chain amino acid transport system substrate-binding protein